MAGQGNLDRAPWIIAGGIVLAGLIVAVALVSVNMRETPSQDNGVGGVVLIDAQTRAQDRSAQSDLRLAYAVAAVYYTDSKSYTGFDVGGAASIEPTLLWGDDAPATPDTVSINLASGQELVLSTMSDSGQPFCMASYAYSGPVYGKMDAYGALSASDCGGGW